MDENTAKRKLGFYVSVLVDVDLTQKIPDKIWVEVEGRDIKFWQKVKTEAEKESEHVAEKETDQTQVHDGTEVELNLVAKTSPRNQEQPSERSEDLEVDQSSENLVHEANEPLIEKDAQPITHEELQHEARMGRKQIDPPDCYMSPLKSRVLMEPPDGNLMKSLATDEKLSIEGCTFDKQTTTLAAAMYKDEPESRTNIGNQPGENTLKKELWREFEAASLSSNVLRLDASVFRDTSRKGFLDRLEKVCEDMSSEPEDNIFILLVGRSRASHLRPFSIKQTLIPAIDIQRAATEPPYPDPITTTSYPASSSP
ncbi:hypothetical protein IFM89_002225 [Coptis chinensis]|uniref:Uncharacterized protein n=1 Tax=Coptis chinensis TaxID=261450 RepID=A0A835IGI3_9MAGN|nr:hypothetical protein IFM89_002225 [Coptis chinensis]